MNRFKILDSFAIEPDMFVFGGVIVEGNVCKGMKFEIPEAGHRWQFVIRSVEFMRKAASVDENNPECWIAITVQNAIPSYLRGMGVGWITELHDA